MNQSPKTRREVKRFLKFTVVGAIGFVVDFGTFNLLSNVLGLWSIAASTISFAAAVSSNFIWNYFWTYPDSRTKSIGRQAAQFAIVNLIGLAIRTPIFAFSEAPFIEFSTRLREILPANLPSPTMKVVPVCATETPPTTGNPCPSA